MLYYILSIFPKKDIGELLARINNKNAQIKTKHTKRIIGTYIEPNIDFLSTKILQLLLM